MDGRLQELNGKAEKLVTVVVPVYNVQKYLRNCLDSVVTQTYEPIEVILVDDGSTDQSGKSAMNMRTETAVSEYFIRKIKASLRREIWVLRKPVEIMWCLWMPMMVFTGSCWKYI